MFVALAKELTLPILFAMIDMSNNTNLTEDTSTKEKKRRPAPGEETGRQSTYIGANIPGALGAAGILTVNPTALGTLGMAGLGFGGWGGAPFGNGCGTGGFRGGHALWFGYARAVQLQRVWLCLDHAGVWGLCPGELTSLIG